MIRLDSIMRKLQVVMGGAKTTTEPTAMVSFFDINMQNNTTRGAMQIAKFNDTTNVDACAAPTKNFVRNIDTIMIYNADSVSQTVGVQINDGGTITILKQQILTAGQTLGYSDSQGWQVI